ncbi:MAG: glucose-6-phosphate dehydrogenase [Ornithinimicrobium sp.]
MTETTPTTLIILGASGDLTSRLLLPGLASLLTVEPERRVDVVGVDRGELSDQEWHTVLVDAMTDSDLSRARLDELLSTTSYAQADVLDPQVLADLLRDRSAPVVLYFALPPQVSVKVCALLEHIDLPPGTQLALEKPFGHDFESAQDLNAQLLRVVPEEQIHRVDHFLGVNTVLNLIGIRFANRLLQPVWSAEHIERVDITYDENLALEGRASYYDRAGALVDMVQSHLLQILALFAMEAPASLTSGEVQALKSQVLRATHLLDDDAVLASRRARYEAGQVDGREVPDYVAEQGVDPQRSTETLAEVILVIDNARWSGVPFRLRSGKALGQKSKRITVTFKAPAHLPTGLRDTPKPDVLVLDLKPGAVSMVLSMNAEGDPFDLEQKSLTATLGKPRMLPHGEVLAGILEGDPLLSIRGDVAEQCWRIMTPVLQAWHDGSVSLDTYPAGTSGPEHWPAG